MSLFLLSFLSCTYLLPFCCTCQSLDATNDTFPYDYELQSSEQGLNDLLTALAPELSKLLSSTSLPAVSSPGLDTEPSYFSLLQLGDVSVALNSSSQGIVLSVASINASIASFAFVAKQNGLFSTVKCRGTASPALRDWSLSFSTHLRVNRSCALDLHIDDDSIRIAPGELRFDYAFDDALCNALVGAADYILDLEATLVDAVVSELPPLMASLLKTEIDAILPSTQSLNVETFGLESNETVGVCYTESVVEGAEAQFFSMAIDLMFNWTATNETERNDTESASVSGEGMELGDVVLIETYILIAVVLFGCVCGNVCMVLAMQCSGKMECCECCECCKDCHPRSVRFKRDTSMMSGAETELGTNIR